MACSTIEPPPTTTTVVQSGIAALHPDILETHILTRLDGPTLASASCADTKLHALSTQPDLWITICTSTWPSTSTPRLLHLMSSFPDGPRSFFSSSYPILHRCTNSSTNSDPSAPPVGLISAVDIYYNEKPIISKVQETETATEWFRCSPFRIDVLDPKDVVPTSIQHPGDDDTSRKLGENISLSWIVMDTTGRRAANLSSHKAVSVERHWLSGEVQLRFASILGGDKGTTELVQCGIVVTCDGSKTGEMQVTEVSLQLEDMDGVHLMGKESLVILHKALKGQKVKKVKREHGGREGYQEYLEMKRERKERKIRLEGTLDMACLVAIGIFAFSFGVWRFAFLL